MTLRFFDTYTRRLRDFAPLQPGAVGLYTYGPTVYDYAHVGNLRTYIFEDVLRPRARLPWLHGHTCDEYHRCGPPGVRC
jgi:cysteinyl-tRNA synthetase